MNFSFYYFRLLALKALNSRLIDTSKDVPRTNNMDSERNNEVVISIGETELSPQASPSNMMISNKKT